MALFKSNVQTTFSYLLPSGTRIALSSDADLKRAIQESEKAKQHDIRIEVQGPSGGGSNSAPHHAPATQAHAPSAQAHAQATVSHANAPATSSGGAVISFTVNGQAGGADKVKVVAAQQADSYNFTAEAAALDTLVEVELPNTKALLFKLSSSSGKISQTFNMPFDVAPKDLTLEGHTVILIFPWM